MRRHGRCGATGEDTTIPFRNPAFRDELSEPAREGAQRIIRQAVEAESEAIPEGYAADRDAQGRRAVVPGGCLPSREVLTGVGPGSADAGGVRSGPHR